MPWVLTAMTLVILDFLYVTYHCGIIYFNDFYKSLKMNNVVNMKLTSTAIINANARSIELLSVCLFEQI
jgi:hypothetical protein